MDSGRRTGNSIGPLVRLLWWGIWHYIIILDCRDCRVGGAVMATSEGDTAELSRTVYGSILTTAVLLRITPLPHESNTAGSVVPSVLAVGRIGSSIQVSRGQYR